MYSEHWYNKQESRVMQFTACIPMTQFAVFYAFRLMRDGNRASPWRVSGDRKERLALSKQKERPACAWQRRCAACCLHFQRCCNGHVEGYSAAPASCKGWVHFQGQGVQDYCWELIWPPGRFAELYSSIFYFILLSAVNCNTEPHLKLRILASA